MAIVNSVLDASRILHPRNRHACLAYSMSYSAQPMNKSLSCPSQTSLTPIHTAPGEMEGLFTLGEFSSMIPGNHRTTKINAQAKIRRQLLHSASRLCTVQVRCVLSVSLLATQCLLRYAKNAVLNGFPRLVIFCRMFSMNRMEEHNVDRCNGSENSCHCNVVQEEVKIRCLLILFREDAVLFLGLIHKFSDNCEQCKKIKLMKNERKIEKFF